MSLSAVLLGLNVYLNCSKTENYLLLSILFSIHVSLTHYCNNRIIQVTAPFCCFAVDHTHHITLIFLQQRMTVNGDGFHMKMVSDNPVRHSVATPASLRCKQAAYKNRILML